MGEERILELRQRLREPVEIRHGEFKPLGECTAHDLHAAAQLSDQRAVTPSLGFRPGPLTAHRAGSQRVARGGGGLQTGAGVSCQAFRVSH
ncbi:MAG: hypothetical protein ACRDS0_34695 [Pseudonocardiaceae bacterium]